jgi:hypothetical protein
MNIVSSASATVRSWDRRVHRRFSHPPLHLEIDGKRFTTTDWSLGGFRIDGYREPLAVGARLTGQIQFINPNSPGTFVAEVVRIAETGEVGLRLLEITPAVFVAMARFKDY